MTDTLFLDIENDGPRLLRVGWALNDGPVQVADAFPSEVGDSSVVKVTQGDHDLRHALLYDGVTPRGPWHNVMVMAWVADENQPLDQESLTKKYTPLRVKHKTIAQRAGRLVFAGRWHLDEYDQWPDAVKFDFDAYCARDVATMRELYGVLKGVLHATEWEEYWETEEVPYSSVLLRMEARGMPIDLGAASVLADEVRGMRDGYEAELREMAGLPAAFNLRSPLQVRDYLFSKLFPLPDKLPMTTDPLPSDLEFEITKVGRDWIHGHWLCKGLGLTPTDPPKRKTGPEATEPSTASPELLYKHGDNEWVQKLCLGFRRNDKLLATYLDKFPKVAEEGRIYGRFNQTGTVTGRLSSSDPNLQNIPARREMGKRVRGLFRGRLVIGDYDSLEMRLMAHYSRDPKLLRVFEEHGDPHVLTAEALFGGCDGHDDPRRDIAKTVNYAISYGAGARKLAQTLSVAGFPTTFGQAKEYQERVGDFYPRLFSWKNRTIWTAKDLGYVTTIGGRQRRLFRADEGGKQSFSQMGYGERQAVNSVIQGSAADILRRVMLTVDEKYPELRLIAQVHDELLWEYDQEPKPHVLEALQVDCQVGHGFDLRVPLVFEPMVCDTWQQKGEGRDLELEAMQA